MSEEPASTLGDRLLQGVRNLWSEVMRLGKVSDHQGREIQALKDRLSGLESQVHGLKTSRGKAIASNVRLKATLAETDNKLGEIARKLSS